MKFKLCVAILSSFNLLITMRLIAFVYHDDCKSPEGFHRVWKTFQIIVTVPKHLLVQPVTNLNYDLQIEDQTLGMQLKSMCVA